MLYHIKKKRVCDFFFKYCISWLRGLHHLEIYETLQSILFQLTCHDLEQTFLILSPFHVVACISLKYVFFFHKYIWLCPPLWLQRTCNYCDPFPSITVFFTFIIWSCMILRLQFAQQTIVLERFFFSTYEFSEFTAKICITNAITFSFFTCSIGDMLRLVKLKLFFSLMMTTSRPTIVDVRPTLDCTLVGYMYLGCRVKLHMKTESFSSFHSSVVALEICLFQHKFKPLSCHHLAGIFVASLWGKIGNCAKFVDNWAKRCMLKAILYKL